MYLKACVSVLEAQRGLEDYSQFYTGLRPRQALYYRTPPRFSTGSREPYRSSLMEGGAHQERGSNRWQESRDSHFNSALICPNNGIHLTGLEPSRGSMRR